MGGDFNNDKTELGRAGSLVERWPRLEVCSESSIHEAHTVKSLFNLE